MSPFPQDVTVKGWVVGETDMAWFFMWEERTLASDQVVLPKSQVAVVRSPWVDEVTMPLWLAKKKGLY